MCFFEGKIMINVLESLKKLAYEYQIDWAKFELAEPIQRFTEICLDNTILSIDLINHMIELYGCNDEIWAKWEEIGENYNILMSLLDGDSYAREILK
jgi:hypothetical protein